MRTRLSARDGERLHQAREAHLNGDLRAAQMVYARLHRKYPRNEDVKSLLAVAHLATGKPAEALPMLRGLVQVRPNDADLHYNLGVAHAALEHWEAAASAYRQAIAVDADHPRAYYNLGVALRALGRHEDALAALRRDYALSPGLDTCRLLRESSAEVGEDAHALQFADAAVALEGAAADDLHRLVDLCYQASAAAASVSAEDLETLIALGEQAVRLSPSSPTALMLGARAYTQAGQFRCALPLLETAVQIQPDDAALRTLYGVTLCTVGEIEEGWRQRTWLDRAAHPTNEHGVPRWCGQDEPGARVLVTCEQGVGDQVLYARLLPELVKRNLDVTFQCDARLVDLLARSFPEIAVTADIPDVGAFDCFLPLGELHLYTDLSARAKLVPDADRVAKLKAALPSGRNVGLSWLSHSGANGASKSLNADELAQLLELPGINWVDLQYGGGEPAAGLHDAGVDLTDDLDGLAALVAALDGVVTVSNATAHVAAAAGADTHVLVGQRPVWHWLDHGQTVPWYPNAHLHRQVNLQGWLEPIAEIADELQGRCS